MTRKVTEEMKAQMKILRFEKGWKIKDIAKKFKVHKDTVAYHLSDQYREKVKARARRWHYAHFEKDRKRKQRWRAENPILYRKIMCLSLLKGYLKRGIVTKNEVLKAIKEIEN